jgi:hypothetical protein
VPAFSHVGSLNRVLRPAEINAICSVIAAASAIVPPTKHATAGELAAAAPPTFVFHGVDDTLGVIFG